MEMISFPLELFQHSVSIGHQTLHGREILPWDRTLLTEKLVFSLKSWC